MVPPNSYDAISTFFQRIKPLQERSFFFSFHSEKTESKETGVRRRDFQGHYFMRWDDDDDDDS